MFGNARKTRYPRRKPILRMTDSIKHGAPVRGLTESWCYGKRRWIAQRAFEVLDRTLNSYTPRALPRS